MRDSVGILSEKVNLSRNLGVRLPLQVLAGELEPVVGLEPTTYGLRNRCSTTELYWRAESAESAEDGKRSKVRCAGADSSKRRALVQADSGGFL